MASTRSKSSDSEYFPAIASFTYSKANSKANRKRSNSFCTVFFKDGTTHVYQKSKILGSGSYGVVSSFESEGNGKLPPLAVKEYLLRNAHGRDDESNLRSDIKDCINICKKETWFTHKMNGFALNFHSQENIAFAANNQLQSYPRSYMLMEFIDGTLFGHHEITSLEDYLTIYQAVLEALDELHKKNIVHRDIKSDNLFICFDKNKNYKVRFIDPSFSLEIGDHYKGVNKDTLTKQQQDTYAPEFFLNGKANPAEDVFSTGKLFNDCLKKLKFSRNIEMEANIQEMNKQMLSEDPSRRPSVRNLIDEVNKLKLKLAIQTLKKLKDNLMLHFPDDSVIDKWCYCERLIYQIEKNGHLSSDRLMDWMRPGYDKLIRGGFWDNKGVVRFKQCRIDSNPNELIAVITSIEKEDNRLFLLQHLQKNDPFYLVSLFNNVDIQHLVTLFSESSRKTIWSMLFKAKYLQLKQELDQATDENEKLLLDQMYYCQRFLVEKSLNSKGYLTEAYLGWQRLQAPWQEGYGLERLTIWIRFGDIVEKPDLLALINQSFSPQAISDLIKKITEKLFEAYPILENGLQEIDKIKAIDKTLYEQFLHAAIDIYDVRRVNDLRGSFFTPFGFSIFNRFPKDEKLQASRDLRIKKISLAAQSGDLGKITKRLMG